MAICQMSTELILFEEFLAGTLIKVMLFLKMPFARAPIWRVVAEFLSTIEADVVVSNHRIVGITAIRLKEVFEC
jgi:hypothetical protein